VVIRKETTIIGAEPQAPRIDMKKRPGPTSRDAKEPGIQILRATSDWKVLGSVGKGIIGQKGGENNGQKNNPYPGNVTSGIARKRFFCGRCGREIIRKGETI